MGGRGAVDGSRLRIRGYGVLIRLGVTLQHLPRGANRPSKLSGGMFTYPNSLTQELLALEDS